MLQLQVNEATAAQRRMPILLVDITDGLTEVTGETVFTVTVSKNGGAYASGTGTIAEVGTGTYYYELDGGEVDTVGFVKVRVANAASRTFYGVAQIVSYDMYSATLGLTIPTAEAIADAVWDEDLSPAHTTPGSAGQALLDLLDGQDDILDDLADVLSDTNDILAAIAALSIPTAAAIADAVWDEATAGHVAAGSFGKAVSDILVLVSSFDTDLDAIIAAIADLPEDVTDAVWDEPMADHLTAGTTGATLAALTLAGIADAVWDETSPGHTNVGKAGYQLWTVLDSLLANFTNSGIIPSTSYDTTTVIGRQIKCIRQFVDEPSTNAKYSDDDILGLMRAGWTSLMVEISANMDNPYVARHTITLSSASRQYVLPPVVGEILFIAKLNTTTGLPEWVYPIRSRWNPLGPGILLEGNVIRLTPAWAGTSETLVIEFVPSGDISMIAGTASAVTSTTVTLPSSPTTGTLDTRLNGYAGSLLRFTEAAYVSTAESVLQERMIASYNALDRVATVDPPWDPVPDLGEGDLKIEIVPAFASDMELCICMYVATMILSAEGDERRRRSVDLKKAELFRNLKLRVAHYENQVGTRFQHDTRSNTNYNPWWFGSV